MTRITHQVDRIGAAVHTTTGRSSRRHWLRIVGVGYALSWIAGMLVWAPSTTVRSSGSQVLATTTGHEAVAALQYVLTEGLPAVGLLVVGLALASATRPASRLIAAGSVLAAAVSAGQCLLGLGLTLWAVPAEHVGAAGGLFEAVTRLDGVKMAAIAVAAATAAVLALGGRIPLPRWLIGVSLALAVSIAATAVGYLLLLTAGAVVAYVSLPLLIVWITGTAWTLRRAQ